MGREKLKLHTTEPSNLIGSLRGEVGEIITAWIFLRNFEIQAQELRTDIPENDIQNPELQRLNFLCKKFADEITSRLSELGERKVGQINFYFVSIKLKNLSTEVSDFESFVVDQRFREKRNNYISHKTLPPIWEDHRLAPYIPYRSLVKGIAHAVKLMKQIDTLYLGPKAKYLWHEVRKRRYTVFRSPNVVYTLMPYLHLAEHVRLRVLAEETAMGKEHWVDMPTKYRGRDITVRACKEWGVIQLGSQIIVLKQYPLIELNEIDTS
ncbi:MAG TPA: hypothetical protein VI215_06260 [Bacteroidota bacterium]